jgi:hypothetical protein
MDRNYEAPVVRDFGTVQELTQSNDKIGSIEDILTPIVGLDGEILPDV